MLRFTKRADYGLMAIHYIAVHDDVGAVSAKRIAEEFGIPPELLAKILQRLAKRRLIMSQSGPIGLCCRLLTTAQSTTACAPGGRVAAVPCSPEEFGQPAGRNHPFGWVAEGAVDAARAKVARLFGARDPKEVVFTSGGTEAINL